MNPDPLAGPRAKVERAKRHVQELQGAIKAFLDTRPYEVGRGADGIYRITRVEAVPIQIAAITGDALNNLRSTLDHIAYRAVSVGLGQAPANPWKIQYPIANSVGEYLNLRDQTVKGARQDALDAIDATKPYFGGNDVIWRIHKLNNIDKHRFLLTTWSAFRSVNLRGLLETGARGMRYTGADGTEKMTGRDVTFPDLWLKPAERFPLEVGKELPSFNIDPDKKMEFRADIALGEPPIVGGDPLLETLLQMVKAVDDLLPAFESCLA